MENGFAPSSTLPGAPTIESITKFRCFSLYRTGVSCARKIRTCNSNGTSNNLNKRAVLFTINTCTRARGS